MGMGQAAREEVLVSLRLVRQKKFGEAEELLTKTAQDEVITAEERAILYSTLGLIYKMQGKLAEADQTYSKAEAALPDDPLIKMIIARFLINDQGDYDRAMKKARHILKVGRGIPTLEHQGHALLGLSYLKKGLKRKASEMLTKAMKDDFGGLSSSENIDFQMVEAFVSRNLEINTCRRYIQAAINHARERREYRLMSLFQKLYDSLEVTEVTVPSGS